MQFKTRLENQKLDREPFASNPIYLSIIIPAFNEENRLPLLFKHILPYFSRKYPSRFEIILVDDGSVDKTSFLAKKILGETNVIQFPQNKGKGAAVRKGMQRARGEFCLFMDSDGATPVEEEEKLMKAIEEGADLAIGSRAKGEGKHKWLLRESRKKQNSSPSLLQTKPLLDPIWEIRFHRHIMGRVFSFFVQRMTGLPYLDTQCGFKLFRKEAAKKIFSVTQVDRFAFDIEILLLAKEFSLSTVEVPVSWHEVAGSKVRIFRDALEMIREVLRLRKRQKKTEVKSTP